MTDPRWQPRSIYRFVQSFPTSTSVLRVDTDAGEGFLKAMGNPEGPHVLACELVGTLLADWLGLPTLAHALVFVAPEDELPLRNGVLAAPGPAFITRAEQGFPWGGDEAALSTIRNPADIARLVVLDTWIRNCDRYRPEPNLRVNRDNVFLVRRQTGQEKGLFLLAMDHTHAFTCGRELTRRMSDMDNVRDTTVFGCFPEFRPFLKGGDIRSATDRLGEMNIAHARRTVSAVPAEWQVEPEVRDAWSRFIADRAAWVSENISELLGS